MHLEYDVCPTIVFPLSNKYRCKFVAGDKDYRGASSSFAAKKTSEAKPRYLFHKMRVLQRATRKIILFCCSYKFHHCVSGEEQWSDLRKTLLKFVRCSFSYFASCTSCQGSCNREGKTVEKPMTGIQGA